MTSPAGGSRKQSDEAFVQLLTAEQLKLLRYITMLLGDSHAANNVLQETNLVLWRKSGDFESGTSFSAWSHQVAYWQVQAYVRDRNRDRHVFSEKLIEQLRSHDVVEEEQSETRLALRHCLKSVSESNIRLLRKRYEDGLSIRLLAKDCGKTESAVKVGLLRIRRALLKCIEQNVADGN